MGDASEWEGLRLDIARRHLGLKLELAGIEGGFAEARRLLQHVTKLSPEKLMSNGDRIVSGAEARMLEDALVRRTAHEPLSRVLGERGFYGRLFTVTPSVLDPRPETELLIDQVLQWADDTGGRNRPLSILDVGTGSGCILITLLAELPQAQGLGTDVSADALEVAHGNALRNGVVHRARFEIARSLQGIRGPFDVLVSNPPYIPTSDIADLDIGARNFDPMAALDGGPDGLAIYREIADRAGSVVPSGLVAVEVGAGQAAAVAGLLEQAVENKAGAAWTRADLGGHDRTVALLTQC